METSLILTLKELGVIVGVPVVRSVAGWLGNALKDSKISLPEWQQLFETVVRVGSMGFMAYLGFSVAGIDNAVAAGAISAYFADKVFSAIKRR